VKEVAQKLVFTVKEDAKADEKYTNLICRFSLHPLFKNSQNAEATSEHSRKWKMIHRKRACGHGGDIVNMWRDAL
jgi:hypothetical protein